MEPFVGAFRLLSVALSWLLVSGGCSKALVHDDVKYAQTGAHCSGSESVDDSSLAVLPIPVVAFFVPHWNLHDIKADDYLKRCGDETNQPPCRSESPRLHPGRADPDHQSRHLAVVSGERVVGSGFENVMRQA
jgi:hypothetical protein